MQAFFFLCTLKKCNFVNKQYLTGMNKILVLTDFSDNANQAAKYACLLAKNSNTKSILLFHNFDASAMLSPNEMSSLLAPVEATGIFNNYEWASEQIELIKKENLQEMEELRNQLLPLLPPNTQIEFRLETSNFSEAVNRICKEEAVDLVVMGIKGRTGIEKVLMGSNAIKAIESLRHPLLIVPRDATVEAPETILIATDLKTVNERTLLQLDQLLSDLDTKVFALNVMAADATIEKTKSDAAPLQQQLIKHSAEFHFIKGEDVETGINQFAIDHKVSMIISLHRVKNFLDSLFHRSITKKLAWHTKIPLLVINVR